MSKYPIIVSGGGGKGGNSAGAVEADNTLRSKQVAHIIDLLGEGEWEGLVDGPGGVYLNDVALFTPTAPTGDVIDLASTTSDDGAWPISGTWNYAGISLEFRHGTQSQSSIKSASGTSFIQAVNLAVVHSTPIIAAIVNPNVDTAVVNVQVNQLYQQDPSNGNLSGYAVDIQIDVRHASGAWTTVVSDRIEGKTMSAYVRAYAVDLHAISLVAPWDVRVTRISADDPDSSKHSLTAFVGIDLMSRDKFRYPNSVLCSIGIDASQLGSIPTRAYDCKMLRVRVPSNYNPVTRVYTGIWDGTFSIAWTDNPAWCLYDLVTARRYGLGEYVDDTLTDKWALYTISQYCDALVPDGFGGTEPRFTLNAYFQTADEAITVIQIMASVFRGILYYLNESLTALQDSPSDAVYQFNTSNVVDGIFSYEGASGSARHTVAMVVWNNPEISYKQDIEIVEDPAGLLRFGYRPITVQALGCTSRGQAHRLGLWTLYVEQHEADIVSFSTALEGTGVQPGNIIDIYDPTRANIRLGGRITNVAGQTIYLDKSVLLPGGTHSVSFIGDDGSLITRTTTVVLGDFQSLLLNGVGVVPSIGSLFGVETSDVFSQQFKIISITESDRHKYDITAIAYNSSKYDFIENNLALQIRPIRASLTPQSAPTDVVFTESLYLLSDGSIRNRLIVSWRQNPWAIGYVVSYKVGSGNWSTEETVQSNSFTIASVVEGWVYTFKIAVISINNVRGATTEIAYTVIGEKFPPPPFDEFSFTQQTDGTTQISYAYTVTEKPLDYLGAQVRYFPGITADWNVMFPLAEGFFTYSPIESNTVPSGTYTIAIKAEDRTHSLSTPLFASATIASRLPADIIRAITDDNMLSRGEKRENHMFFEQLVKFHDSIVAQAAAIGITTELTNFTAAYNELGRYLQAVYDPGTHDGVGLGSFDWIDVTTDSIIDGTIFRAKFFDVFQTGTVLSAKVADVGQTTATVAQTDATSALAGVASLNASISNIASDNVLDRGEKRDNHILFLNIVSFHDAKIAEAVAAGLGSATETTNFTNAYNALGTYLAAAYNGGTHQGVGTGGTDWLDTTTDSIIDGTTFRSKFNDVFTTGDVLARKLTEVAATTATWSTVTGTGKPADNATVGATWNSNITAQPVSLAGINSAEGSKLAGITAGADVTASILSSSGTSIVMASSNLFKSGTGLGGVFIGAGGLFGRNSSGSTTFSIDGSTGAASFTGDITGASNIDITGTANIHGTTTQTLFGGSRTAALLINGGGVNSVGAWGFSNASGGMGLRGLGTGFNGTGIFGEGQGSAGSQSAGVAGSAINSGNYGVIGNGVLGAKGMLCVGDLEIQGAMTLTSTLQATNLNANYLQGFLASAFLQVGATAADSSSLGGFGAGSWMRQTGVTGGSPGTAFTHTLNVTTGGISIRIPIFFP